MPTPARARSAAKAAAATRWDGGPSWEPVKTATRTSSDPASGPSAPCSRDACALLTGGSRAQASAGHPRPVAASRAGSGFTVLVVSSTDGWAFCALGHRHWGRAGAAGLLLHRSGPDGCEVLHQHRARWSHHGGTWSTPGGALHHGESAHAGALREVREELGLLPDDVVLGAQSVDDHGGWSYTTVLAQPARRIEAGDRRLDGEGD